MADDDAVAQRDNAAVRFLRAHENAHEAGLAGAIAPHESELFTLVNAHRGVIEDLLQPELKAQIFGGNDSRSDGRHGGRHRPHDAA